MKIKYILFACITCFLFTDFALSQAKTQLYGKVQTRDESFTGFIRWGKEEVFWTDFFNATKRKNQFIKHLNRQEIRQLRENRDDVTTVQTFFGDINFSNKNWSTNENNHVFVSQFGDIKELIAEDDDEVTLVFKNGDALSLDDGSNDVGASIYVIDKEMGQVKVSWSMLKKIEFMEAPETEERTFGKAIYGTVDCAAGSFSGFIQWDHDERLTSDKLDGDYKDGEVSLSFSNIALISRTDNGCNVKLRSGKELHLTGSNDVNRKNRGIIVTIPEVGRFDIPWSEFYGLQLEEAPEGTQMTYTQFGTNKDILGEVKLTSGETYKGAIAYDLDESYDFEMLDGRLSDIKTYIPFRNIKSIQPTRHNESKVTLRNGAELNLRKSQDVSENNDGLLLFMEKNEKKYIPWRLVQSIVLK